MTVPPLAKLKAQYFPPGLPSFDENSEFTLFIDGDSYFREIDALIASVGLDGGAPASTATRDEAIYILGWTFDMTMDLQLRPPGTTGHMQFGQLLAEKQAAGVDVRVVLNGAVVENAKVLGLDKSTPFLACWNAWVDLRERTVNGMRPLVNKVLFDWSGAPWTGSQHQKVVIVKAGDELTAFVGGFDFFVNRHDPRTHDRQVWVDGTPWGWHDVAVRLRGEATRGLWRVFASRWSEARTLPERKIWTITIVPSPMKPAVLIPHSVDPSIAPVSTSEPTTIGSHATAGQAALVLRSRWPHKLPRESPPVPWDDAPPDEITDIYVAYKHAIDNAETYIYIEDQFVADSPVMPFSQESSHSDFSLFPALRDAVKRGVKLIFVSSGKSDPDDLPVPTLKNQTLTDEVQKTILDALPTSAASRVAFWRLDDLTVHSKICFIDDVFCCVGTANIQSRSMSGVDSELQVFIVDDRSGIAGRPANVSIRDWRVALWAEHIGLPPSTSGQASWPASVQDALENINRALGMWRPSWNTTGAVDEWFVSDSPAGFAPTRAPRSFVGPMPGP